MFLNENLKLETSFFLFIATMLIGVASFFLNEFIFYIPSLSFIINILFFAILFFLFFKNKLHSFLFLLSTYVLFYTRPRSLHIVAINDRVSYDFYSFHSQFFGPFVFSTSFLILISLYTLFLLFFDKSTIKLKNLYPILIVLILLIFGSLSFIFEGNYLLFSDVVTDSKNFVFLFSGLVFGHQVYSQYKDVLFKELINVLLFLLTTNLFFGLANLIYDFLQGSFQLQYSFNTYMLTPIFFLCFLVTIRKNQFLLVSFLMFFLCIFLLPFTRGEQLNFIVVLLISIALLVNKATLKNSIRRISFGFIILIILFQFDFLNILYEFSDQTFEYFVRKASFFIEFGIDKSIDVRLYELRTILSFNNFYDYYQFLFGSGLGSYFSFDTSYLHGLHYTDFSKNELTNNAFRAPHSFLAYYLLKIGIVGTGLIFYFYFSVFNYKMSKINSYTSLGLILYSLYFFSFLWNAYWIPFMCFFSSFYVGALQALREENA